MTALRPVREKEYIHTYCVYRQKTNISAVLSYINKCSIICNIFFNFFWGGIGYS